MRKEPLKTGEYVSCIAWLIGGAVAFSLYRICLENALQTLSESIVQWFFAYGTLPCFAGMVLWALLLLLCSISALGCCLIPVIDSFFAFCISFSAVLGIKAGTNSWYMVVGLAGFALSALSLLRISATGVDISVRIARLWRSDGARSFDLRPMLRSVWTALLILLIMLLLQNCLQLLLP